MTLRVTDEQLAKWKKLMDETTSGPYVLAYFRERPDSDIYCYPQPGITITSQQDGIDCPLREEDARFIVAARTVVPALLDEVERLREEVEQLCKRLADWQKATADQTGVMEMQQQFARGYEDELRRLRAWETKARAAMEHACSYDYEDYVEELYIVLGEKP